MKLEIILSILFIHWVADFVFQTSWQAENKSKQWSALLAHTGLYSLAWFPPIYIYGVFMDWGISILLFIPITFVCHTATDYYTSRVNLMLWEKKEVHTFFASVGFDQMLHYIQLFVTFYFLNKYN